MSRYRAARAAPTAPTARAARTASAARTARPVLPLLLLAALPAAAGAQSASQIIEEARQAFERRASAVENYTVVQRVMGHETATYFVREEIDGFVVFLPKETSGLPGDAPTDQGIDPAFFFRGNVADRMTYEGLEEVGGNACHAVALDDFEGLGLERALPDPDQFRMKSMRFCLDTDEHVVRRMVMTGTTAAMGEPRDVTTTVVLEDYREVSGMLHPFRMEMTTSGLGDAMQGMQGMQGNQGAMAEAMAEMEKHLEQLPEAQREQMRKMMESRMEGMEGMKGMAGMMDAAAGNPIVVEVLEVRVNEGPPARTPASPGTSPGI